MPVPAPPELIADDNLAKEYWRRLYYKLKPTDENRHIFCLLCYHMAQHQRLARKLAADGEICETNTGGLKAHPAAYLQKASLDCIVRLSAALGKKDVVKDVVTGSMSEMLAKAVGDE